jgi:hypothetical protein
MNVWWSYEYLIRNKYYTAVDQYLYATTSGEVKVCNIFTELYKKIDFMLFSWALKPIDLLQIRYQLLDSCLPEPKRRIPNFEGPTYQKGDEGYDTIIRQYASINKKALTAEESSKFMEPFMHTVVTSAKDVAVGIKFALANKKKVVAKSGGHQYGGKSSGGSDIIVLDLHRLNSIDFN